MFCPDAALWIRRRLFSITVFIVVVYFRLFSTVGKNDKDNSVYYGELFPSTRTRSRTTANDS